MDVDFSNINILNLNGIEPYKYSSKFDNIKRFLACVLAVIQGCVVPLMINCFGNIFDYFVGYYLNLQLKNITKIKNDKILKEFVENMLIDKPNTASFEKKYPNIDVSTIKTDIKNSQYANYKLGGYHEFLTMDTISNGLNKYFTKLFIITIVSFIISFTFIYLLNNIASNVVIKIRSLIYKYIINESISWHEDKRNIKKIALDYNASLSTFEKGIGPNYGFIFLFQIIIIVCVIMPFLIELKFSIFVLLTFLITIVVGAIFYKGQSYYIFKIIEINSNISHYIYKKILPLIKTMTSYGVVVKDYDWIFTYEKGYIF